MLEKLKYHLSEFISDTKMRIACLAVLTATTIAAVTLLGNSVYTVNVFDGEKSYTVRTLNNNALSVLSNLNLKSQNYDITETDVKGRTTSVKIAYTYPVYVTCADKTTEVVFCGGTVEDALFAAGYTVDEFDFVEPAADKEISSTIYIDYVNIDYVKGNYTESIPYATETVYSDKTDKGVTTLVQKGSEGVKQVSYTEKIVNGVSQGKTVTSTTVVTAAVNAKKVVGTKETVKSVKTSADVKSISVLSPKKQIELDAKGNPVNYKSKMTVRATAYTYTGHNCSTGVAPKPGYIAVNPKVIPYGTKLYIKSPDGKIIYGYAVAADTGGFIKKHPTGIDLFMATESACRSFGVRNMEVYILE